jgi:hypothetical protein
MEPWRIGRRTSHPVRGCGDMIKHTYRFNKRAGICGVDMYWRHGWLTVVLTELRDSTFISVTHCMEELATDIAWGLLGVDAVRDIDLIRWIEHYEAAPQKPAPFDQESWHEVTMEWDGDRFTKPCWRPMTRERWQSRPLGQPVEPHRIGAEYEPVAGSRSQFSRAWRVAVPKPRPLA